MDISVCMAIHNGEDYLIPQMKSILMQLKPTDEIVAVDDASTDNSANVLSSFSDKRLRVVQNRHNLGVLASFEKALRLAHGDILFLSDQDDIWLSHKVETVINAFSINPEITLVASDAKIIDGAGRVLADSFFSRRGPFSKGMVHNFLKNKHLGCTLAFRRSMLSHFIPIPRDIPMHDIWFGLINAIYGEAFFIDQPLIAYRRHKKNVSPSGGVSVLQKMIWRCQLLKNLIPHLHRAYVKKNKC